MAASLDDATRQGAYVMVLYRRAEPSTATANSDDEFAGHVATWTPRAPSVAT